MTPRTPSGSAGPLRRLGMLLGALTLLLGVFYLLVRPWYQTWGASAEELRSTLPGDELGFPGRAETRAIAIAAPAGSVFAWVAQLGQDRGGFYSYELLEDLMGCEMPRIEHLDATLQHWKVGQKLWMYPPAKLHGQGYATLLAQQPQQALVFGTHAPQAAPGSALSGTWSFVVEPTGERSSRLIVRSTGGTPPSLLGAAFQRTVFEPVHFVMERRMLEGVAALAEGRAAPSRVEDGAVLFLWTATFGVLVGFAGRVLRSANSLRALIGFVAAGTVFQLLTFGQPRLLIALLLVAALIAFFSTSGLGRSGTSDGARLAPER